MTYVWLTETNGTMRFVDDIYLPPCQDCGERVSVCRANDCFDKPEPNLYCPACGIDNGCRCDEAYEAQRDAELGL